MFVGKHDFRTFMGLNNDAQVSEREKRKMKFRKLVDTLGFIRVLRFFFKYLFNETIFLLRHRKEPHLQREQ